MLARQPACRWQRAAPKSRKVQYMLPGARQARRMTAARSSALPLAGRLRKRQELHLAAALSRADRPMASGWWALLILRGLLPACLSIATGVLVGAIQGHGSL